MKYTIATSVILAMISPDMALARPCHSSGHRGAHLKRHHVARSAGTKAQRPIVVERDAQTTKVDVAEISLDASGGKPLRQLLSENLGAQVEWSNGRLGERVVSGNYHGSPEYVAQQLLKDFQFAIFYDHARLRIIVLRANGPEVIADNRPRGPAPPQPVFNSAPNSPPRPPNAPQPVMAPSNP